MADSAADENGVGTKLAHYEIQAPIGEGAMGVVYRAHDLGLDRPVALKVLKSDVSSDAEFVERFVREARAAACVTHPNLTHIYFVGEQDGHHFFAMEYVEGRDLETVVAEEGRLDLEDTLDVVTQIARGLGAAHDAGVVHRDVKPSNVILQRDGTARITDFGLAKSLDADVSSTRAGQVIGTPTFMSPEQCLGRPADHRTDMYALGLTMYHLLTGTHPYRVDSLGELINAHVNQPLPPLASRRDDLPAGLDGVLAKLCAKAPADRPADMAEVVRRLAPFRARPVQRASLVLRGLAALVDLIAFAAIIALILQIADRVFGSTTLLDGYLGSVVLAVLLAAYHILSESWWQRTLGKWLFQCHVVSRDGSPPRRGSLLPRFVLRYPVAPLSLLGVPDMGWIAESVTGGIQVLAILLGIGWYVSTNGSSLSDVLTSTRVAIRMQDEDEDHDETWRKDWRSVPSQS